MWHFLVAKYLTSYGDVNVFAFSSPTWAELTTYVPEDISPNRMHDKKPDLFLPNSDLELMALSLASLLLSSMWCE